MKYDVSFFPKSAVIELTNICNLDCIHCYLDKKNSHKINDKYCIDVIEQLSKFGCFRIVLTGGEVFVYRELLFNALEYAKQKNFEVTIITNLTLCSYQDLDKLYNLGLDNIHISLYGASESTYKTICGNTQNVAEIQRKILYAKKLGINVTILSVGIDELYYDLLELNNWCKENDLKFNIGYVLYGKERGEQNAKSLNIKQMVELLMFNNHITYSAKHNPKIVKDKASFCSAGTSTIYIAANGDVYPCANWRQKIGSIYDSTILEIWENSVSLKHIQKLCYADLECSKCEKFDICPVCPGINYSSTGNISKPSKELCKYVDALCECQVLCNR